jgi:hypothetical protein
MRRLAVISALGLCFVLGFAVAAAPASSPPILKVKPRTVHLGHTVTIRGSQWPVIEFCKRTVRLRLESAQNAVLIGFVHITDGGHFTRHFTPKQGKIGTGTWKVVARQRCESGKDGHTIFTTRKRTLKIKP